MYENSPVFRNDTRNLEQLELDLLEDANKLGTLHASDNQTIGFKIITTTENFTDSTNPNFEYSIPLLEKN